MENEVSDVCADCGGYAPLLGVTPVTSLQVRNGPSKGLVEVGWGRRNRGVRLGPRLGLPPAAEDEGGPREEVRFTK